MAAPTLRLLQPYGMTAAPSFCVRPHVTLKPSAPASHGPRHELTFLRVLVCSDRRSLHRRSLHRSLHHRSLQHRRSLQLCRSLHTVAHISSIARALCAAARATTTTAARSTTARAIPTLAPSVAPPSVAPAPSAAPALSVAPPSLIHTLVSRVLLPLALLLHYFRSLYHHTARATDAGATNARATDAHSTAASSTSRSLLALYSRYSLPLGLLSRGHCHSRCRCAHYRRSVTCEPAGAVAVDLS